MDALLTRAENMFLKYHEINFDDGQVYNAQFTPIPNIGFAITLQDITYLKELDRLKTEFINTVSHDLRSPLTAVLGYTELLGRVGELNEQQREFVQRLEEAVKHITSLVNDLLDLSRMEAGFDTRREPVQIENVLQYTLSTFEGQIKNKQITVKTKTGNSIPAIRANPIRIRQVLDNLVGNAIKYTPNNGRIEINLLSEDHQIILNVMDSGPGIPINEQNRIFEKFYRATNVPNDAVGTGLGLAIVKSIVDSHHGRVWVESAPGNGAVFFVVLPAQENTAN
jgi:two-component system NtrC family sensor kinase